MLPKPGLYLGQVVSLAAQADGREWQTILLQPPDRGFADVEGGAKLLAVKVAHFTASFIALIA